MKKASILLFLLASIALTKKVTAQTDPNLQAILLVNDSLFTNKPLDSIISILPTGYISMKIRSGGHYHTAKFLRILYSNKVWIELYVEDFNFMNPVDSNRNWNLTLMRKENLDRVSVYQGTTCYRGCN